MNLEFPEYEPELVDVEVMTRGELLLHELREIRRQILRALDTDDLDGQSRLGPIEDRLTRELMEYASTRPPAAHLDAESVREFRLASERIAEEITALDLRKTFRAAERGE